MLTEALLRCWYDADASTDASFRLKMLSSLSADKKIPQLFPELESG